MTTTPSDLDLARQRIDSVDKELIRLLRERIDAARSIAEHKQRKDDVPLHDPEREQRVAREWEDEAEKQGLSAYHTGRILREVLNYSRRSQEPYLSDRKDEGVRKVGYQGTVGSYSELAIGKLFTHRAPLTVQRVGWVSFAEVFRAVEAGDVDYALVPIENSLIGSIGEVNHLLATRNLAIVDEEVWDVRHCLVGMPGAKIAELREIRSHAVALQQCGKLLASLPGVGAKEFFDTAGAARSVAEAGDPHTACICSAEAAQHYGLQVLREGVGDHARNQTRFVLVARNAETTNRKVPSKTTVHFAVDDRPGALSNALAAFHEYGVNLVRLESRPQPDAPWEYLFLADLLGHREDEAVKAALASLGTRTNHMRVVGTYPSRALEQAAVARPQLRPAPVGDGLAPRVGPPAIAKAARTPAFHVGGVPFGGSRFALILGPCAVESRAQIQDAAAMVKKHGAHLMRGGAFKPRSSPHSFQGLGLPGLELLAEAGRDHELPVVTEVLQAEDVEAIAAQADVLQVGARNMQNFALLKKLGTIQRPVLLKRGLSATLKELLLAAEYVKAGGNQRVILCERGIRTFETSTRNTLDISAVPALKTMTNLPVIVDPSHAAGVRHLVVPLALAAAAAGADGLIVECHPRPEEALCDREQALNEADLGQLLAGLQPILASQGRTL